jgi:hypothetical protein
MGITWGNTTAQQSVQKMNSGICSEVVTTWEETAQWVEKRINGYRRSDTERNGSDRMKMQGWSERQVEIKSKRMKSRNKGR